jgi:hypothetical protein
MINWTQEEEISWMPPVRDREHGWLIIDTTPWLITSWHHFNDFGQTIETVNAKSPKGETEEFYSLDDGMHWHTEL